MPMSGSWVRPGTHGAWLTSIADQGLVSVSSFVTLIVVSRSMSAQSVGLYALILAGVIIVSSAQAALVTTPHAVLSIGKDRDRFLGNQFVASAALSVVQAAVFIAGLSSGLGLDVTIVVPATLFLLLRQAHELTRIAYLAELRPDVVLALDMWTHLPRLGLLVLLASLERLSLPIVFWIISASLLIWPFFAQLQRLRPAQILGHARGSWAFGRFLLVEALAYIFSTQAYLYVVHALLDLETVAGLAASQNLLSAVNVVFMGVAAYVLPLSRTTLLRDGYDDWQRLLRRTAQIVTVAMLLIVVSIASLSRELLTFFYGVEYGAFAPFLLGLAIPIVLHGANAVAEAAFQTAERPEISVVAKVAGAAFSIVWAYPAISIFGTWGAVIGLAATPLIWSITYATFLARGALSRTRVQRRLGSHRFA
jgi:O-antigen/teichoic acid export membrane protein